MPSYVEVSINLPQISGTYHYHLPDELEGAIQVGSLVIVPFGSQRVQGVIMSFVETPDVAQTKAVEELLDEKPALTATQMALAYWMAEETLSPLGACIAQMLPPGLSQRTDTLVSLTRGKKIDQNALAPIEKRIVSLLQRRGDLRARQIDAHLRHVTWRGSLKKLARAGIVHTRAILPEPRVSLKLVRKVALAIQPEEISQLETPLSRVERVHTRRMDVLNLLAQGSELMEPGEIYDRTGANYSDLKALETTHLIEYRQVQVWRDPLADLSFIPKDLPLLTQDQTLAWNQIASRIAGLQDGQPAPPILLHGVTGSGKTELYLRAVKTILETGRRAIILVPEISLTPQTVQRFLSRFPGKVGVVHSQLSEGERYDTWRRVRRGELPVLIGPRSALFMPQENVGLIVVDECHHDSYDQQESQPYYQGVKTAAAYARLSGALILLGSATPNVTQYYQAVHGNWTYIELPRRILAHREAIAHHAQRLGVDLPVKVGEGQTADLGLPVVSVVDMRQELQAGNRSIFSRELHAAIAEVLDKNQQAILFLNRRGSATYIFCRDCGYVVRCPRDDKPLTYHRSENGLLCHTCGYRRQVPTTCPQCGGRRIRQLGTGTEKVEQVLHELFPRVKSLRWDAETTRKKGAHQRILGSFSHLEADILIGTQMLAKGLDLPLVTLVGVILADIGLNLPDFRATERTFQVLTQVAGRAGRSPLGGHVVLQTYMPGHYAIAAAAQHDFNAFYQQEMVFRRDLGYPPFTRLVRLEYRHHEAAKAENAAKRMAELLSALIKEVSPQTEMIGPVPCFFSRLSGQYRWQIILRGANPVDMLRDQHFPDWIVEVDPSSLL